MNVSRRTFSSVAVAAACLWGVLLLSAGRAADPDPLLVANGINIRNGHGTGDVVQLRGVNLGTWLIMEGWMCPMDSSGVYSDNYSVIQELDTRFTTSPEQSLIRTYQYTWITTNDLDNIRAMGMNYVRVPFWWGDVQTLSGAWRGDAFDRMDWVVSNAWQRGLYTILDLHGAPGGQNSSESTGQQNQNQYWTSSSDQNQTAIIWSNVAAHFAGNPAVAGYDLINEPSGAPTQTAIWSAYNSLYQTVRAVDTNHMIMMEGTWTGTGTNGESLNWQWDVLPNPTQYNWSNVVYEMHSYPGTNSLSGEEAEADKQVSDFQNHQSWNVPCLIGEFNCYGTTNAWPYFVQQFDTNNMSWSVWSYKAIHGSPPDGWGLYDPVGTWPSTPNIQTSSTTTISNDWSAWSTKAAFGINPMLQQYLGGPLAVADSYTATSGVTLTVSSSAGVLANDLDINLGQPGIQLSAVLVSGPTNGQLTLNADGSFSYTPAVGFTGTDTFRYSVYDGYANSVNIADVSIQVSGSGSITCGILASDTANDPAYTNAYPLAWSGGLNGGYGFGAWTMNPTSNSSNAGFFIGSSISNGVIPSLGIDVNGKSWGLYANTNGSQGTAVACRSFAEGSLGVGQSFNISMDNGYVNSGGGAVGWILRTGNDTANKNDGERFEFSYLGGGIGSYQIFTNPAAPPVNTSLGYTDNGFTLSFTLTSPDTFSLAIVGNNPAVSTTVTGTLGGTPGSAINSVALYNQFAGQGANYDLYFNSMSITGCVSSVPAGPFNISSFQVLNGSNVVISFVTTNGASYAVESTSNLVPGAWSTVTNNILGTGGMVSITSSVPPGATQQFYRGRGLVP
ncbi:MAG: cellulase family glycosylhydrolase [Verrucomicrobiia bacterium]